MTQSDSLWPQVQQQANRLLQLVRELTPKGEVDVQTAHAYILGMYWRCLRLYEATLLLLSAGFPEEAVFLARSLFEDSLHLQQLAAEPEARDALILGWANRSIDQKRGLFQTAKALGLDKDVDEALASLEDQRKSLTGYASRHGVRSFSSFRSVKDAATRYDRKEDVWTYEWAHEFVHGTDAAYVFARRKLIPGSAGMYAKTEHPELRAGFAEFAARSLTDASAAICRIFGWPIAPDLEQPVTEMRRLLDQNAT